MYGIILKKTEKTGCYFLTSLAKKSFDRMLNNKKLDANIVCISKIGDYTDKDIIKFIDRYPIDLVKRLKRFEWLSTLKSYTEMEILSIIQEEFPKYYNYTAPEYGCLQPISSFHTAVCRVVTTNYILIKHIANNAITDRDLCEELFKTNNSIQYEDESLLSMEWTYNNIKTGEIAVKIYKTAI